jgi:hypothetical protein
MKPSPILKKLTALYRRLKGAEGSQVTLSWRWGDAGERSLEEALELDPTEVTARMIVEAEMLRDLEVRAVPLRSLLEGDAETETQLDIARELIFLLRSPELNEPIEGFRENVREAMRRYGALDAKTEAVISDRVKLAHIRLSALGNVKRLSEFQFTRGDCEASDIAPIYYEHVYEFWNVNSMLAIVAKMKPGVMLALVRDSQSVFSYFAFCVRNGANIYVVTDRNNDPHPEYRNRTRKPERTLERRIDRGYFPYDLLNIGVDSRGHVVTKHRPGLVPYQSDVHKLRAISKLEPEERIWVALMLDLLVHRYWIERRQLPQLSYTGEMLKQPTALLDKVKHLPVVQGSRQMLVAPELAPVDLTTEKIAADVESKPIGHNRWMEERYGRNIDPTILNAVVGERNKLLLNDKTKKAMVVSDAPESPDAEMGWLDKPREIRLSSIRPDDFNTKDRLLSDRRWVARTNLATVIAIRAEQEFEKTEKDIVAWYTKRVLNNLPALIEAVRAGSLKEKATLSKFRFAKERSGFPYGFGTYEAEMLSMKAVRPAGASFGTHLVHIAKHVPFDDRKRWKSERSSGCALRQERSRAHAVFTPHSSVGLAMLAGCTANELPEVLQHWWADEPYHGNSILARIDPLDCISNPWASSRSGLGGFSVAVCLSLRALHELGWGIKSREEEQDSLRYRKRKVLVEEVIRVRKGSDSGVPSKGRGSQKVARRPLRPRAG